MHAPSFLPSFLTFFSPLFLIFSSSILLLSSSRFQTVVMCRSHALGPCLVALSLPEGLSCQPPSLPFLYKKRTVLLFHFVPYCCGVLPMLFFFVLFFCHRCVVDPFACMTSFTHGVSAPFCPACVYACMQASSAFTCVDQEQLTDLYSESTSTLSLQGQNKGEPGRRRETTEERKKRGMNTAGRGGRHCLPALQARKPDAQGVNGGAMGAWLFLLGLVQVCLLESEGDVDPGQQC